VIALAGTRGRRQHLAASQYRENAAQAQALARDATLDRVRERHEHAAATWNNLAALSEAMLAREAMAARPAPIPAVDILDPARS
jgi:hypothetical protein